MATTLTTSVAVSALVTLAPNADAAQTKFKDVQSNAYFYEAVTSLHARNIISGYEDGTFRPNETLTRAHAAKIIALALDLDTTNIKDPGFKDVSKENVVYKYIAALANKGIVMGSNGEYKPNNPITRAQMAKIISLAYKLPVNDLQDLTFVDVNQNDWFYKYVGALVENQITTGTTSTTFSPNKNVTRGQMAAFVYRGENKITPVQVNETIANITNEALVTTEGTYYLSDEQKKWMNPSNLVALKGAKIKLTSTVNKIENIQSIEFTANGTTSADSSNPYANHVVFDGKGATIDANVIINSDYFTMGNITIKGDLHIGKGVENSFFSEFTKVEGKTTIDDSLQVASQTKSYKTFATKVASTNNFPVAVNETKTRGKVVFSEFQLGVVGVDKNADVIFLSKIPGTSTVGEIVVNSNAAISTENLVVLPKVVIAQGATDVAINSNVTSLQVTTTNEVKISGKSDIANVSLMTKANVNLQTVGRVSKLEIPNNETKTTIGTETKIGNLVIPTGVKPADVIGNYNAVKVNVEQVGGTKNPDLIESSTGNSGGASIDVTAPVAVTGVTGASADSNIQAVGGLQNTISWAANIASDLSYYEVFRSTNSNGATGATKVGSNIAKNITTFTDNSVTAGTTYYYTVFAVDATGNRSERSNVGMVATVNDSFTLPTAPTGLQSVSPTTAGNDGKITGLDASKVYQYKLITDTNWTNVPLLTTEITGLGAASYEVRFAANGNVPASLPTTVSIIGTIGTLTVNAVDDALSNDKTSISIDETPDLGSEFVYKVFDNAIVANAGKPTLNADVSSWDILPNDSKILAANGKVIVIVEKNQTGQAKKVGQVAAVTLVNNQLLETVMLDGKDGVSSQDGKVETIRLKFSANIKPTSVNNNSFTVNGFDVESIKVTDKNGRTPFLSNGTTPNPLYTQGENQYITIRVTPKDGTHYTPVVTQNSNGSIVDVNGVNITGVNVTAVDQAAPVIISSAFVDNGSPGMDAGDQLTITFSEDVITFTNNLADLANDFALNNQTNANFTFTSDDKFALTGNTVTVTLGSTTVSKMDQNTTITISANGNDISLLDAAFNKAKPQKVFVDETVYSNAKTIDITNIPSSHANTIAIPNAAKAQGTNPGTIQLTGLTDGVLYEYLIDNNATTSISTDWSNAIPKLLSGKTAIDNISVDAGQYVHIRVASAGAQPASDVQDLAQITIMDIKPAAAPTATAMSTVAGYTKLQSLIPEETYEYYVDSNANAVDNAIWLEKKASVTGEIENIPANTAQYIHIRVKETLYKPASDIQSVRGQGQNP